GIGDSPSGLRILARVAEEYGACRGLWFRHKFQYSCRLGVRVASPNTGIPGSPQPATAETSLGGVGSAANANSVIKRPVSSNHAAIPDASGCVSSDFAARATRVKFGQSSK